MQQVRELNVQNAPMTGAGKKRRAKNRMSVKDRIVLLIPVILFLAVCLIPFIMMLSASFTTDGLLKERISLLPRGFTLDGYRILFRFPGEILKSYGVSLTVTLLGTVLNIVFCGLMAYPLSDPHFKDRRVVSFILFFSMLFQAGLIPTYIIVTRIFHLNNTIWILIIMPLCQPAHIFLMRVFFQGVSKEVLESARMDGMNEFRILFTIAMPMIIPGLATISFQFVLMYWNDSFTSLYFADDIVPIALYIQRWRSYVEFLKMSGGAGLTGIIGENAEVPALTVQYAMAVLTTLPLIFIFMFFQKYYVRGLTAGAVKG